MTSSKNKFAEYPREVRNQKEKATVYELLTDRYAVHRPVSESPRSADAEVIRDDDNVIEIRDGEPGVSKSKSGKIGPVYALQPGGTVAVPTGRVFITLAPGIQITDRSAEIGRAGFEIAQTLDYAPNAGWLRPRTDEIQDALNGVAELEKIADVENVEPQMLMRRVNR